MKNPILAVALAAVLGACSMAPRHELPPSPVDVAFPTLDGSSPVQGVRPGADIGWREVFADPRLQQLIGLALENNRDLRLAALNVEAARAQYRIQRADRIPGLAASAEAARQRLPAAATPPGLGGGVNEQYSVGVGLTAFELDLFGRVRSLRDAALAQFLATSEARRGVEISLVAAVANAYLAERAAEERLALITESGDAWNETARLAQLRFDAGVGSALDLAEAQTLLQTARADLAAARREQAQARNQLVFLVGQPLPAGLPEAAPLGAQALAELPPGLPSDLIARRPDILAAEQGLRAANANIGAARAAFFPRISLTGFLGSTSSDFSGLFESGTRTWSFVPQLTLPIFDAGRNAANLDLAQVRAEAAVAEYELAVQGAFREVADALAARDSLVDQVEALQALVDATSRRFELSELRFESGIDSSLVLLDAQRSLYTAQQGLLQARLLQLTSSVDLYRALGGGWSEYGAATPDAAPAAAAGGPRQEMQ